MFFSSKRWGKNNTKTIGRSKESYAYSNIPISAHAEIDALKKIKSEFIKSKKIKVFDLIVLHVSKNGYLANGKPCYHCIKQLQNAYFIKIKNVFYSESNGIIKHINFNDLVNSVYNGEYIFISSGYRRRMNIDKNDNYKILKILKLI